ncbi:MAG: addiction module protein [Labilithrix sp.]|nr:addiction module protein [Labilithrix sp.]
MNARAKKVFEEALELPLEDRGELARRLLESVDTDAPPEIQNAWAPVIARRAREVLDGTAATRDLDEALDDIESRARAATR